MSTGHTAAEICRYEVKRCGELLEQVRNQMGSRATMYALLEELVLTVASLNQRIDALEMPAERSGQGLA